MQDDMDGFATTIARLIEAGKRAYARKWSFLGAFLSVFVLSVIFLAALDLLPDPSAKEAAPIVTVAAHAATTTPVSPAIAELPMKIEIPAIKLSATITNPTSTNVEVLDHALLSGAVRYPTSAKLGEEGNVVLFGHSSYLPLVNNPAFKTFDGIQKLTPGEEIMVSSSGTVYTYRVRTMEKASANDGAIALSVSGKVLTLATCNSFGQKSDRFVVTADFVESHSLGS
jgi:LPXTG-site transpeptidase (sortase) family protein